MKTRSWAVSMIVLLAMLALIAACGGGGGGGGGGTGGGGGLATEGFTKTVEVGAASTAYNNMFGTSSASRYMMLQTSSDIKGSGYIRSVRFKTYTAAIASQVTCADVTIKMGSTTVSALTATFAGNVNQGAGSFTTVLNSAAITIPVTAANTYYNIDLAMPFYYNGVDNLVIEVTRGAACSASAQTALIAVAYIGAVNHTSSNTATTGTAQTYSIPTELVFSDGDNTLDYGGANNNTWPFSTALARQQQLYLVDEINGSGPITGVAFQVDSATVANYRYTATVKIAHSLRTSMSMTWADNYDGTVTTVASEVTFTVPVGLSAGDYFWVPLTGSFTYDGTRNLVVDVDVSAASGSLGLRTSTVVGRRTPGYHSDGAVATASGQSTLPNIKLRFNGGTVDVLPPGNSNFWLILPSTGGAATSKNQILYRATDIGRAGSVSSMFVRLWSATSATAYTNFNVTLGKRSAMTLGTSFSANMSDAQTVYSGTLSIPAGLIAGDWIEIPFSTAYNYDGTSNLVVQYATTGAAVGTDLTGNDTATRYPSSYAYAFSSSTDTASVINGVLQTRLKIR